jgi:hypothetical protein
MTEDPKTLAEADEMQDAVESDAQLVRSWDADRWKEWFLQFAIERNFHPLSFSYAGDLVTQIGNIHRRLATNRGEVMKKGLAAAIRDCASSGQATELPLLAWTAARVRASAAVPDLIDFVSRKRNDMKSAGSPLFGPLSECVSVLAGFAPDNNVQFAFEGLAFDGNIAPEYSALLLLGLCACNPPGFTEYLEFFVKQRAKISDFFNDRWITMQFFSVVPPASVKRRTSELSEEALGYLLDFGGADFLRQDVFGITVHDGLAPVLPFPTNRESIGNVYNACKTSDPMRMIYKKFDSLQAETTVH